MEIKQLTATLEAVLFASGEPVSVERLADAVDADRVTIYKLLDILTERYAADDCGICLLRLDAQVQLCTKAQYAAYVRRMLDMRRNVPLSPAAMEVLAIVAYNQPVTKAFVEQIRGVDCSGVLGSLTAKGLVEEKGRLELPGRPLLYGTTTQFLRCFSISSLDELPALPSKQQEEQLEEAGEGPENETAEAVSGEEV